jgi:hypothetical protein
MSALRLFKAIWQLRYPVAPRLLDIRGAIAQHWHQPTGELSEWRIEQARILLHSKSKDKALQFETTAATAVMEMPKDYAQFSEWAQAFSVDTLDRLEISRLDRVGLRLHYFAERPHFKQLVNKIRNQLFRLDDSGWNILGGRPIDLGFHVIFDRDGRRAYFRLGPMEKEQISELVESREIQALLPVVSLYADVDLSEKDVRLKANSRDRYVQEFLGDGGVVIQEMIERFVDHYEGFV